MSQPQVTSVAGLHSEGAEKVEEAGTEDVFWLEREGRAGFLSIQRPREALSCPRVGGRG